MSGSIERPAPRVVDDRPAVAGPGLTDRLLRRAALRHLARIETGHITLVDAAGTERFGAETGDGLRATMRVEDPSFYRQAVLGGSLGVAEAYIDGRWSSDDLVALFRVFVRNIDRTDPVDRGPARLALAAARGLHALRRNTRAGSRRNIAAHYDLGNDFFALFLDETMTYSCGIFERPDSTLFEASLAKIDRACRKLDLRPGDHLLEIGTGWGSFAIHAAREYGCRVTTTTVSRRQFEEARRRVEAAGLSDRVTLLLEDYRDLTGTWDKLVSIEMVEAVGHGYLDTYFERCASLLRPEGMMMLQAITMNDRRYPQYLRTTDFIREYVFPGGCCPSTGSLLDSIARSTDMHLFHLEDIGPHYARTLRCWRERFNARLDEVRALGYSEPFIRLWDYYLATCEAAFEERYIGDAQMLLTRPMCRRPPLLPALDTAVEVTMPFQTASGPTADLGPSADPGSAPGERPGRFKGREDA